MKKQKIFSDFITVAGGILKVLKVLKIIQNEIKG